jgi:hypothetical protein
MNREQLAARYDKEALAFPLLRSKVSKEQYLAVNRSFSKACITPGCSEQRKHGFVFCAAHEQLERDAYLRQIGTQS